jgi:type III pantothenate kinase
MSTSGVNIIALNIGNSRTQIGRIEDGNITISERWDNSDLPRLIERVVELWRKRESKDVSIVMASVNEHIAERIRSGIEDQLSVEVYTVGDDMPIPIGRQLDPETITGVDRLLNAAAAYDVLGQACVIVDAGTAVTVDFVDGEGTFHGGAIAPGVRMQLRALHEHTSALPELDYRPPEDSAFGRNTAEAMLQGVTQGIRGMVWRLVEQYAEAFGAYPMVIATGGDAEALFGEDELIDRHVADLTLMGIAVCVKHALRDDVDA